MTKGKRPKIVCEVCGETDTKILERHHIIPRTELNCTNDDYNLGILCSSCHSKTHTGSLKIIGVFPGTRPPSGRVLIYELDGVKNIDIDEPYYTPKPQEMKVHYGPESSDPNGSEQEGDN